MGTTFQRTLRSLDADNFRALRWGFPPLVLLLVIWGVWFCRSRVGVYEVSSAARLEVDRSAHSVQTPVAGTVVNSNLVVGRSVGAGEVILELDAESQLLQRKELQAKLSDLRDRRASVEREIAVQERVLSEAEQAAKLALAESRSRYEEAQAAARFAKAQAERLAELREKGTASEMEALLAKSELEQRLATEKAARIAIDRVQKEHETRASERAGVLEQLRGQLTQLEGEAATAEAAIRRLDHEIDLRHVRAPVSGEIAEAEPLSPGMYVRMGERLAAIVPSGKVKVVAHFHPARAMGRVRAGQSANIRFHGFPWGQYGMMPAVVTTVAGEVRDGRVRVELAVDPKDNPSIPIQHGLPCVVEVEVERISPLSLVLRTAGKRVWNEPAEGIDVSVGGSR